MTSSVDKLRIIVLGYIVRGPLGGLAWHHLQYVMGLARMGHDVYFLEDSEDYESCYDPVRDHMTAEPDYGLRFAQQCFGSVGLADRWAYFDAHTDRWLGPLGMRSVELCQSADVLLNLSAINPLRPWCLEIPHRALVDTDPVFTQLRHLSDESAMAEARRHNSFHTFGENFGMPDCCVPEDGLPWQGTRQPVVLDAWSLTPGNGQAKWTTIMQWDSYASREFNGQRFGMKSDSFNPYIGLPEQTSEKMELALGGQTAPRERLAAAGWSLIDSREPTRDPWTYQDYLRNSKGEFGVAKHGYVASKSGWFSERTAAYLASGRPAVVQDTGFTEWLPCGEGVLSFSSPEEAVAALDKANCDYVQQCQKARELAEAYFDHSVVLGRLLGQVMAAAQHQEISGNQQAKDSR